MENLTQGNTRGICHPQQPTIVSLSLEAEEMAWHREVHRIPGMDLRRRVVWAAGVIVMLFWCAETPAMGAWFKKAPAVESRPASALGTTAMTVNGRIQPYGQPTTYWFEYGTSTEYGQKTAERELPPRLAAYYHESWDDELAGWRGGMSSTDLTHLAQGGKPGGFVRFSEPTADDTNHADGIGTVNLAQYFYPGTYPSGSGAYAYLAAGYPDLRDARVSLWVRGNHWVPNGSELVFWAQSDNDIALQLTADWRRANWAFGLLT